MTETKPTYTSIVTALDQQTAARRRILTYAALNDAGAAEDAFKRLIAYIDRQRGALASGQLDDAALYAVRRQLGDLKQCAEALGVGL